MFGKAKALWETDGKGTKVTANSSLFNQSKQARNKIIGAPDIKHEKVSKKDTQQRKSESYEIVFRFYYDLARIKTNFLVWKPQFFVYT